MATWVWEFGEAGSGLHFTIAFDSVSGEFTVKSLEGSFDLNALWWNDGVDDGNSPELKGKDSSLNMNGTGEDWDGVMKLSNPGLGKDGENKQTFVSEEESWTFKLSDFGITGAFDPASGGTLGVRATSVNGDGSIKLVDNEPEGPPPPPPPQDDFPKWPQDISNIVLYFDQTEGDTKPKPAGDGYYLVKIDNVPGEADDDLDNWIGDVLAWLIENDDYIDGDSDLLGAAIKGGNQQTLFYAYGDNNTNGTDPDPFPVGAPIADGGGGNVPGPSIDETYNYDDIFSV